MCRAGFELRVGMPGLSGDAWAVSLTWMLLWTVPGVWLQQGVHATADAHHRVVPGLCAHLSVAVNCSRCLTSVGCLCSRWSTPQSCAWAECSLGCCCQLSQVFDFSEVFVQWVIHTIELCLGYVLTWVLLSTVSGVWLQWGVYQQVIHTINL